MYPHPAPALSRFFSGLAEYAFQTRLGVADPPLIEYMADLLVRFIRYDAIFSVRSLNGRRLDEMAAMILEAQARQGDARREVHRHIGDFALFWTGVYPEALREMRGPSTKDQFVNYCYQGKWAY